MLRSPKFAVRSLIRELTIRKLITDKANRIRYW